MSIDFCATATFDEVRASFTDSLAENDYIYNRKHRKRIGTWGGTIYIYREREIVSELCYRAPQALSCSLSVVEPLPSQFRRHLGFAAGRKGVYQGPRKVGLK